MILIFLLSCAAESCADVAGGGGGGEFGLVLVLWRWWYIPVRSVAMWPYIVGSLNEKQ